MKTLTIRLNDDDSNLLSNYMRKNDLKTASGALLHALARTFADEIELQFLHQKVLEQQSMLDGFSSARDAFKAALNYLDQKQLFD